MSSIDRDNLHKIVCEVKGFLRPDIVAAIEAAGDEIDRLQEVVKRLQKEKLALKG